MIKINKNLHLLPESLKPATEDFFPLPETPPVASKTTHTHRLKIIDDGFYTECVKFNARYKYSDVKDALAVIYFGKCAYCEQKVELTHVEHYRPKNLYYWLVFSWDNLLLACPHCNDYKGTNFEITGGMRATFTNNANGIRNVNNLSASYDFQEQPNLVNPEITDPVNLIRYYQDGSVDSLDPRFTYTIDTCRISRTYLRDERRKLLEDFKDDVSAVLLVNNKQRQIDGIKVLVEKFIRDSNKSNNPFLGFRRYAIRNRWLKEIVKELLQP